MLKPNTSKNSLILDAASIIVIATSLLYLFGMSELAGRLIAYNLPETLLKYDFYSAVSSGFLILYASFVIAPIETSMAAFTLLLALLYKYKKIQPAYVFYILLFLAIIGQANASRAVGEYFASKHLLEITNAFKGNNKKTHLKNIEVTYVVANGNVNISNGYLLNVPSNYLIILTDKSTIAINRENISTVKFE